MFAFMPEGGVSSAEVETFVWRRQTPVISF